MKTIQLFLFSLIFSLFLSACDFNQEKNKKSANASFVSLSEEEGFAEKHDEPKQTAKAEKGKMEKISIEGGDDANVYFVENQSETKKYLLVFHEWWGLNEHIKKEAEKWFEQLGNVHVMAIDLYDGKVAKTRENAQKYMQSAEENRMEQIIKAAIQSLPEEADIATIGWCFGGGWSLRAAILGENLTQACVVYYGMPVKDVNQLKRLNSDVLFIYGKEDQWITQEVAQQFETNMEKAGKSVQILGFDADHAFANPSSERYVEEAAQTANQEAFEYLQSRLQ